MTTVSVVIPNYNGEKYINGCLDALKKQSTDDFDVIIVDNGSEDDSLKKIEECSKGLRLSIIKLDKNYGFAKAVNEGIKASKAPFVILLNNDTCVGPHFVAALLARIQEDKRIFSAQAHMLKYDNPHITDSAGDYFSAMGWGFQRGRDKAAKKYRKPCDIFSSCGGAAIYRREIFDIIGYFDENFFAYLEDVDIGFRARLYGYRNVYAPRAKVLHMGSASSGSRYNGFKVRLSARNSILVMYKNFTTGQKLMNMPLILLGIFIKTLFFWRKHLVLWYLGGVLEAFSYFGKVEKTRPIEGYEEIMGREMERELLINVIRRLLP